MSARPLPPAAITQISIAAPLRSPGRVGNPFDGLTPGQDEEAGFASVTGRARFDSDWGRSCRGAWGGNQPPPLPGEGESHRPRNGPPL